MTPLLVQALVLSWMPGAFWLLYVESRSPQRSRLSRLVLCLLAGGGSVWGVFGFHALTAAFGWISNEPPQSVAGLFLYFATAVGLLEETCKLLAVLLVAWPRRDFREPWDGLACATAVALGLATGENFKYVLDYGNASILLGRFFLATFAHVVMSGVWGYALGLMKARHSAGRHWSVVLEALGWAALFHGAYDWFLTIGLVPGALAVFLGLILVFRQRLQEAYYSSERRQRFSQQVRECQVCRTLARREYAYCPSCGGCRWNEDCCYCLTCLARLPDEKPLELCPGCCARFI